MVHGDLAPSLALQTILHRGRIYVDVSHHRRKPCSNRREDRYELVLTETGSAPGLLAYARVKEYRPATDVVTSFEPFRNRSPDEDPRCIGDTEHLPDFGRRRELSGARPEGDIVPMRHALNPTHSPFPNSARSDLVGSTAPPALRNDSQGPGGGGGRKSSEAVAGGVRSRRLTVIHSVADDKGTEADGATFQEQQESWAITASKTWMGIGRNDVSKRRISSKI